MAQNEGGNSEVTSQDVTIQNETASLMVPEPEPKLTAETTDNSIAQNLDMLRNSETSAESLDMSLIVETIVTGTNETAMETMDTSTVETTDKSTGDLVVEEPDIQSMPEPKVQQTEQTVDSTEGQHTDQLTSVPMINAEASVEPTAECAMETSADPLVASSVKPRMFGFFGGLTTLGERTSQNFKAKTLLNAAKKNTQETAREQASSDASLTTEIETGKEIIDLTVEMPVDRSGELSPPVGNNSQMESGRVGSDGTATTTLAKPRPSIATSYMNMYASGLPTTIAKDQPQINTTHTAEINQDEGKSSKSSHDAIPSLCLYNVF